MRLILVLSFYTEGELYAAGVSLVQTVARNLEVTPVPSAPSAVAGIANLKGKAITLLRLAALMQPQITAGNTPYRAGAVVFKPITSENDQMGLIIERPGDLVEIDEARIVPPPLAEGAEALSYISGVAEENGALYRILDIKSIIDRFRNGGEPQGGINDEQSL